MRFLTIAIALMAYAPAALANEGGSGLPQFNSEWFASQIFWLAVTFVILYVFFGRYALPRVEAGIHYRQKKIQHNLDQANELSAQAKAVRETYERNMLLAKNRATDAMRQADTQLKAKVSDMLYSYRTKFTQEIARTENELLSLRSKLQAEMQEVAAEIAAHAASNILHAPADLDRAQAIVADLTHSKKAA